MSDDASPLHPADASELLDRADRTPLVSRQDRAVWTLRAVVVGVLWAGFGVALHLFQEPPTASFGYFVLAVVVVAALVWSLWRVTGRRRATPYIGWATRMWPGPLPMVPLLFGGLVGREAGLDMTSPLVLACYAVLVALPCLAVAHRFWSGSWVPGRGAR